MYEDIFELVTIAAQKRNLKESTAKAYCHALSTFLNTIGKPWQELTITDVDDYLTAKRLAGIMPETYNHYYGALRFMYKRVLKLNWDEDEIPRMKRDRSLPTVLAKEEIEAILDTTTNLKYKAIFAVMYSGGLRVSEATHLHYDDISRSNHSIHIRNTKNRMDRYTILADRTLDILTEYWFKCGKPRNILFPSQATKAYLETNSINQVLKRSAKRAGITVVDVDNNGTKDVTDFYGSSIYSTDITAFMIGAGITSFEKAEESTYYLEPQSHGTLEEHFRELQNRKLSSRETIPSYITSHKHYR